MSGLLKIILGIVVGAVALVLAAVIILPMVIDPNDYKGEIIARVEKDTGRRLELPGDIELTVFPWLGVDLGALALSAAPGFGDRPFIQSQRARVRVKLLPLLQQRIEMDTVVLEGLELNLVRDSAGRFNWETLGAKASAPSEKPAAPPSGTPAKPEGAAAALALGGVVMKDARISWDDRKLNERYAIERLNLETGAIEPGEPVPLELSFGLAAGPAGLSGDVTLEGAIAYALEAQGFGVKPLSFTAKLKGQPLPGGALDLRMTADAVSADLSRSSAEVDGLRLEAAGATVSGDLKASDLEAARPVVSYRLHATSKDLSGLVKAVAQQLKLEGLPKSVSQLSFDLGLSGSASKIAVEPLKIEAALAPQGAKGPLMLALSGKRLDLDIEARRVAVSEGRFKLAGKDAVAVLKELGIRNPGLEKLALGIDMDTAFSGTGTKLALAPFTVQASLAGETLPGGSAEVTLATRAEVDLERQALALDDLALAGLGLDLRGGLRVSGTGRAPKLSGTLSLKPFDARRLLTQLGQEVPDTADPKALTKVGFETAIEGSTDRVGLSKLVLRLDDTEVKGGLAIANLARPAVEFKLSADALDADRYLPPEAAGSARKAQTRDKLRLEGEAPRFMKVKNDPGAGRPARKPGSPLRTLRTLNLNGDLTLGKLKIKRAQLSDVRVGINARQGTIELRPLAAGLYQGRLSGVVRIEARGRQANLSVNPSLTGVQIEPLLADLTGKAKIAGTAELTARINAVGIDADSIKRTLAGRAEFQFRDGALIGINLGRLVRSARAGFVGKVEEAARTDFSEMTGTASIDRGVVTNKDLALKSPLLRIAGAGNANLVTERIDYTLNTTLTATAEGQGGREAEALGGVTIPIKVSGTFDDPSFTPDLEGLAKAKAKKELDKQKDKLKEKIDDKLKDLLKF